MNDYTNELNRCWLRIGAISKVRAFTGEELEYKYPLVNNGDAKNLQQAYEKFNSSFDDLLKAEMKHLNSLKETTEMQEEELTATEVADEDLKYLRDVAEKEFRVCKHEKSKDPCVINISLNVDKDIDIETIANELVEKLKNEKNVSI